MLELGTHELNPFQNEGERGMRRSFCVPTVRRRSCMLVERLEDRQLLSTITVNTTADDPATGFHFVAP